MSDLSIRLQFFTGHSPDEAQSLCEEVEDLSSFKVRLLSSHADLQSRHILAQLLVPNSEVQAAAEKLNNIALYIAEVTRIDDIIVKVMGHPDVAYRTNPPAPLQA